MQKEIAHNIDELSVAETLRQCASCAVIVIKKNLISFFTPDAAELIGVKPGELSGKQIDVLPEPLRKPIQQALSDGKCVSTQVGLQHPTRGELKLHITATRVQPDEENVLVTTIYDLSYAQKLEEKIGRIDKLASIGTLSASMAHEIKNALVAVRTFIDLLLTRNQDDELAGIVGREMTRIDSIVSQILTFSGPAKPVLAPLKLHDILNHSLKLVEHQIRQKNIGVERTFTATPDIVKGDAYQLKQAFLNLLLNAIEATPASGKLTVSTDVLDAEPEFADVLRDKNPARLRVILRDSGIGIPPENLNRVFDPFFTTKPKGTGLGLAITRRIVQEHRAAISVESEQNRGAAFQIVFPVLPTNSRR